MPAAISAGPSPPLARAYDRSRAPGRNFHLDGGSAFRRKRIYVRAGCPFGIPPTVPRGSVPLLAALRGLLAGMQDEAKAGPDYPAPAVPTCPPLHVHADAVAARLDALMTQVEGDLTGKGRRGLKPAMGRCFASEVTLLMKRARKHRKAALDLLGRAHG